MRAASIRQPWAWLATHGHIGVINVDWPTTYRGEFLIRAGLKLVQRDYRALAEQLQAQLHIEVPPFDDLARVPRGGIVGIARLVDVVTSHPSPHFAGPYGWVLEHAAPLPFTPLAPPQGSAHLNWFGVPRAAVGLANHERGHP
jgi:hypothetical protein